MISFPSILFPVDLSPQSRAAAPFVKAMAARFHSQVTALHVLEVPPAWYGPTGEAAFCAWLDVTSMLESRRNELIEFLGTELTGVDTYPCIQSGDAAGIIHQIVSQKHTSLVMMPTHGYGPVRSMLLGSVTAKVLHDAACPVWTVSSTRNSECNAQAPWQRFICAIDSDSKSVPLIQWAADFAAEQDAELKLVHAVSGFDQPRGDSEEDPLRDFIFGVARERIAKLQEEAGTNLEVVIECGATGQVVRDVAVREHAGLALIGRGVIQRPLGRLRSNAYAIVRDAPCPVISI